tara:strand:- start:3160 stop:4179 length:1020 start_codon:yes stop_codon:yes gene_type:complete
MFKKSKSVYAATIGLGFGLNHAKVLKNNKHVKLISISDIDVKKKIYAKMLNTSFKVNLNSIFKNKKINLISIASYDNYHYKHIVQAIRNNKNIFVEKPMCQTMSQFSKITKLFKKSNIKLSSNFVLRYHPKFKKVKELVKKNIIGKIYSIEGEYNYGRIKKLTHGWRGKIPFYSVVQGGGIHIIDLMIWITNSFPLEVTSIGNNVMTKKTSYKYDDNNIALLKFKNNITGKVTSNFSCVLPHHHTLKVFGSKGTIEVSRDKILLYKSRRENIKPKQINFGKDIDYKNKILNSYILSLVNNKKNNNPSTKEIFLSMLTCLVMEKSTISKKWEKVKINEYL